MPYYPILEPAEAALGEALELIDTGILLLSPDLRVRYVNQRLGRMLGVSPASWGSAPTYRRILETVAASDAAAADAGGGGLYEHETDVRRGAVAPTRVTLADGRRLLVRCFDCSDGGRILTYADIAEAVKQEVNEALEAEYADMRFQNETLESQAAYLASLAEAADQSTRAVEAARVELEKKMAEQRVLEAELRRLANTDGLTGALNRTTFIASAQELLERGRSLTAMMLDVDHFKSINDRFGHAAGDHALRQLVAMLQSETRNHDLVGRLGGEEFAVVLPVRSIEEASMVAERLRARVAQTPLTSGDVVFSMTVSIGVTMRWPADTSIEQTLGRADAALYRAKAAGRNRVVVAPPAIAA